MRDSLELYGDVDYDYDNDNEEFEKEGSQAVRIGEGMKATFMLCEKMLAMSSEIAFTGY